MKGDHIEKSLFWSVGEPLDPALFFDTATLHLPEVADDKEYENEECHQWSSTKELCEHEILASKRARFRKVNELLIPYLVRGVSISDRDCVLFVLEHFPINASIKLNEVL